MSGPWRMREIFSNVDLPNKPPPCVPYGLRFKSVPGPNGGGSYQTRTIFVKEEKKVIKGRNRRKAKQRNDFIFGCAVCCLLSNRSSEWVPHAWMRTFDDERVSRRLHHQCRSKTEHKPQLALSATRECIAWLISSTSSSSLFCPPSAPKLPRY